MMKVNLLEYKKNIISWYPIKENHTVLDVENSIQVLNELKLKSNKVTSVKISEVSEIKYKYDVIVLIGTLEKLNNQKEFLKLLEDCKNILNKTSG